MEKDWADRKMDGMKVGQSTHRQMRVISIVPLRLCRVKMNTCKYPAGT